MWEFIYIFKCQIYEIRQFVKSLFQDILFHYEHDRFKQYIMHFELSISIYTVQANFPII